jgi:hypothetical protein
MAKGREQETSLATTGGKGLARAESLAVGRLAEDASEFGMEFDRQDLAVPFLRIIQSNSPQVMQGRAEYMEEARPGMLFNTASRQLWPGQEGLYFLPVTYQRSFIEWKPRLQGGGFVKDHGSDDSLLKTTKRNEKNKDILPNGNELSNNALYYGFVVDTATGQAQQVALVLTGTQMKKSRKLNTALATMTKLDEESGRPVKVPPFYRLWHITTVPERNDQGDWYGFLFQPDQPIDTVPNGEQVYEAAKKLYRQVKSGEVKTQEPAEQFDEVVDTQDGKVPF